MTTEKLLLWNGTVYDALEEMDRRNSWHSDWKGIKESNKIDSFWGNMDNNRRTITISCCGLVAGVDGPRFYLVKAENIDLQTLKG